MFFNSVEEIPSIASRVGCAVFVVPKNVDILIKNALILEPDTKTVISIDQVHDVLNRLSVKQTSDLFILVRPAESLGLEAANAMLKNLEEPGDKVHFALVTDAPSQLLPTILSRSAVYFLKEARSLDSAVEADKKVLDVARRLVVAKPTELPALAEEVSKKKEGVRAYALNVVGTAIEILYKSYFKTEKDVFLNKIPKFLACYEAISNNGHVKLHLVADLM